MKRNKFIIFTICVIILLALILTFSVLAYQYFKPVTISAIDHSFEITMPGKVKFKQKEMTNTEDKLDLYSIKDEMFFNVTSIEVTYDINLEQVANKERESLSNIRGESVKDVSELSKVEFKNYEAQKYTYTYYDSDYNNDIYTEIVWIKTGKTIYVLDFEVINKNKQKYIPIFASMLNSFTEKK